MWLDFEAAAALEASLEVKKWGRAKTEAGLSTSFRTEEPKRALDSVEAAILLENSNFVWRFKFLNKILQ
jgi:hypothetical protein